MICLNIAPLRMIKYSSSASVVKNEKALDANLFKLALYQKYFLMNLTTSSEQGSLYGCLWGQLFFENIPEWLNYFSKAAAKIYSF